MMSISKAYKNYKGETVTNCHKSEGYCLEPNHITKTQLMKLRKDGFNIPIFKGELIPKDNIATKKTLKNVVCNETEVNGMPALEVALPDLGNRKIYLIKDNGDSFSEPNIVVVFHDEEFSGDEAYNEQLDLYKKYGQNDLPYTIVKNEEGVLFFDDKNVGGMIAFSSLEKAEPLRETFDDFLTDTESIMFDDEGKLITDTVLPSLPAQAKAWLKKNASTVEAY